MMPLQVIVPVYNGLPSPTVAALTTEFYPSAPISNLARIFKLLELNFRWTNPSSVNY